MGDTGGTTLALRAIQQAVLAVELRKRARENPELAPGFGKLAAAYTERTTALLKRLATMGMERA